MDPDDAQPLIEAARLVASRDAATAAHLLTRSLESLDHDDPRRREVIIELLPLAIWGGRPRHAERLARAEIADADDEYTIHLRLYLIEALGFQDRWSDSRDESRAVLDHVPLPQELRGRVLAGLGLALANCRLIEEARAQAEEVLSSGSELDEITRYLCLETLASCLFFEGRADKAAEIAEELVTLADSGDNLELVWRNPRLLLGIALSVDGRVSEAETVLRASAEVVRRTGAMWASPAQHCYLALLYFRQGRWSEAVAECEHGLMLCRAQEATWEFATILGIYAVVETRRGAFQNAERLIESFDAIAETSHGDRAWRSLAVSQIAEGRGDRSRAYDELVNLWREADGLGVELTRMHIVPDLVRLAIDANDLGFARSVVDHLSERVLNHPTPLTSALSQHARGVVAQRTDQLERAIELYKSVSHRPHRALAYEELAIIRAEHGQPREARAALGEALKHFEGMGALADARRARARLRWRNVFAAAPTAESAGAGKWASLTKTEKVVAELVAEGLKNQEIATRLFVSIQTVQTHLKNIFKKLGATSRSQVVREVLSHTDQFDDAFHSG